MCGRNYRIYECEVRLNQEMPCFNGNSRRDEMTSNKRKKMVNIVTDKHEKKNISRKILESLPEWFGIEESREKYIADSQEQLFFAYIQDGIPIGFLCLKETGKDTAELSVMGVLKTHHQSGIGKKLFSAAKEYARNKGYFFLQVKTVQTGQYEIYDRTNRFYISLGFKEFEVFPTLWDQKNPCQVYVMSLQT